MLRLLAGLAAMTLAAGTALPASATTGPASNSRFVNVGETTYACTFSGNGVLVRSSINGHVMGGIADGTPMRVLQRARVQGRTWFLVESYSHFGDYHVRGWVAAAFACPR